MSELGEPSPRHGDVDRRVLNFVVEHLVGRGYSPTLREIAAGCGLRGLSVARGSVGRLVAGGVLHHEAGQTRGLQLVATPGDAIDRRTQAEAGRQGLAVLELFALMEHGYYPYLCHAAALAPDLASAQEWLELVHVRVRQLSAVQDALLRARAGGPPEHAGADARDATTSWTALRNHCETVTTWEGWLAIEQYETDLILTRRFPTCDLPASGVAAVALEGNIETARLGRAVVGRAIARSQIRDRHFGERVAAERQRIDAVYRSIGPLLDRIWPAPPSTTFDADHPSPSQHGAA